MSTLSSANVTDVNLVPKERTHMRLYLNMLIFTHNLGNWLVANCISTASLLLRPSCTIKRSNNDVRTTTFPGISTASRCHGFFRLRLVCARYYLATRRMVVIEKLKPHFGRGDLATDVGVLHSGRTLSTRLVASVVGGGIRARNPVAAPFALHVWINFRLTRAGLVFRNGIGAANASRFRMITI